MSCRVIGQRSPAAISRAIAPSMSLEEGGSTSKQHKVSKSDRVKDDELPFGKEQRTGL
jgi:hypothetical protein